MVDQQDADTRCGQFAQQQPQRPDFPGAKAGGRLVKQRHPRAAAQDTGQAGQSPLTEGQLAWLAKTLARQANCLQRVGDGVGRISPPEADQITNDPCQPELPA
jgi:hypothetical protein